MILRKNLNLIFFHVTGTEFGMTAEISTMSNSMVTSKIARISLVLLVRHFLAYGNSKLWKHFKNRNMLEERTVAETEEIHYQTILRNIFQDSHLFYELNHSFESCTIYGLISSSIYIYTYVHV